MRACIANYHSHMSFFFLLLQIFREKLFVIVQFAEDEEYYVRLCNFWANSSLWRWQQLTSSDFRVDTRNVALDTNEMSAKCLYSFRFCIGHVRVIERQKIRWESFFGRKKMMLNSKNLRPRKSQRLTMTMTFNRQLIIFPAEFPSRFCINEQWKMKENATHSHTHTFGSNTEKWFFNRKWYFISLEFMRWCV